MARTMPDRVKRRAGRTPLPARIYANEGLAQVVFFLANEICETSYADRAGKYMGQRGITIPRM